jgi:hypothetical protein
MKRLDHLSLNHLTAFWPHFGGLEARLRLAGAICLFTYTAYESQIASHYYGSGDSVSIYPTEYFLSNTRLCILVLIFRNISAAKRGG